MNLTELKAEVVGITKRPDLENTNIASAIRAATLKMHQADFYPRDLLETVITFPSAEFLQTFDYLTTIPRWRALKYLRRIDSTSNTVMEPPLKVLTPDGLLDDYYTEKTNVVYEAGLFLQIKCNAEIQSFVLGCYLNPDITDVSYTSWVAQMFPYAIIYEAVAMTFKMIGQAEQEGSMRVLAAEQLALIKINSIQTEGY